MILDTSEVIERVHKGEEIKENITVIAAIEFPPILEYSKFYGKIIIPTLEDFTLAVELQRRMRKAGKPQSATDLLIAAMCINRGEVLITRDKDFETIAKVVKDLKVIVKG